MFGELYSRDQLGTSVLIRLALHNLTTMLGDQSPQQPATKLPRGEPNDEGQWLDVIKICTMTLAGKQRSVYMESFYVQLRHCRGQNLVQ